MLLCAWKAIALLILHVYEYNSKTCLANVPRCEGTGAVKRKKMSTQKEYVTENMYYFNESLCSFPLSITNSEERQVPILGT